MPNNSLKPDRGRQDLRQPKVVTPDVSPAESLRPVRGMLLGLVIAVAVWLLAIAAWWLLR